MVELRTLRWPGADQAGLVALAAWAERSGRTELPDPQRGRMPARADSVPDPLAGGTADGPLAAARRATGQLHGARPDLRALHPSGGAVEQCDGAVLLRRRPWQDPLGTVGESGLPARAFGSGAGRAGPDHPGRYGDLSGFRGHSPTRPAGRAMADDLLPNVDELRTRAARAAVPRIGRAGGLGEPLSRRYCRGARRNAASAAKAPSGGALAASGSTASGTRG